MKGASLLLLFAASVLATDRVPSPKRLKTADSYSEPSSEPSIDVDWTIESAQLTLSGFARAKTEGSEEVYQQARSPVIQYYLSGALSSSPHDFQKSIYYDESRTGEVHRDTISLYFKVKNLCVYEEESLSGCVSLAEASECLFNFINQPFENTYTVRFSKFRILDSSRLFSPLMAKKLFLNILKDPRFHHTRSISLFSLLSYVSLTYEEFKELLPRILSLNPVPFVHRVSGSDTEKSKAISTLVEFAQRRNRYDLLSQLLKSVHPTDLEKIVVNDEIASLFLSFSEKQNQQEREKYARLYLKCQEVLCSMGTESCPIDILSDPGQRTYQLPPLDHQGQYSQGMYLQSPQEGLMNVQGIHSQTQLPTFISPEQPALRTLSSHQTFTTDGSTSLRSRPRLSAPQAVPLTQQQASPGMSQQQPEMYPPYPPYYALPQHQPLPQPPGQNGSH